MAWLLTDFNSSPLASSEESVLKSAATEQKCRVLAIVLCTLCCLNRFREGRNNQPQKTLSFMSQIHSLLTCFTHCINC